MLASILCLTSAYSESRLERNVYLKLFPLASLNLNISRQWLINIQFLPYPFEGCVVLTQRFPILFCPKNFFLQVMNSQNIFFLRGCISKCIPYLVHSFSKHENSINIEFHTIPQPFFFFFDK